MNINKSPNNCELPGKKYFLVLILVLILVARKFCVKGKTDLKANNDTHIRGKLVLQIEAINTSICIRSQPPCITSNILVAVQSVMLTVQFKAIRKLYLLLIRIIYFHQIKLNCRPICVSFSETNINIFSPIMYRFLKTMFLN